MIESLQIVGFQKHKSRRIEFGPGVTTIVGPSDAGKSSLLRALYWVCLNRPGGQEFINWDLEKVKVALSVDGRRVLRRRGKANVYALDGKEFRAFGDKVPQEIAELLNVSENNFQLQHDSPFWFSLTPGQVSRELNRIVDLEVIDTSLAHLASELRKASTVVEVCYERWRSAKRRRKRLLWVPEAADDLEALESIQKKVDDNAARASSLGDLIDKAVKATADEATALDARTALRAVLRVGKECEAAAEQSQSLGNLVASVEEAAAIAEAPVPDMTEILTLEKHLDALDDEQQALEKLIQQITKAKELLCQLNEDAEDAEANLHKNMKGRCPLCGKEMTQ